MLILFRFRGFADICYRQILKHYHLVGVDQLTTLLMQEIMALIAYLPMSFRNLFTGIVSSMASSLTTGELALFPFQVGLCFAIIMGVFYRIASRERGKMEQTQIYADCLIGVRKMLPYLFLGNLTRKNDVLLVSLSLHGCSLNGSLYLTMQIDP